ncbi:MAG: hypothetical protein WAM85_21395 [Terracidiphilus sp.]
MKLRNCIAAFAFPAVLVVNCSAQITSAHVAPAFSLALKSPSQSYKVAEPITLGLTITNISKSAIGLEAGPGMGQLERHFFVVAVGPDGKAVQERQYGLRVHGKAPRSSIPRLGSSYMEAIAPGESVHHEIDFNKLYDFSEPGTYDLYVQRNYEAESGLLVKSNHIKIVVIE